MCADGGAGNAAAGSFTRCLVRTISCEVKVTSKRRNVAIEEEGSGTVSHRHHSSSSHCILTSENISPFVPTEHRLDSTAYLSVVADHVRTFMTAANHLLAAGEHSRSQSSSDLRLVSRT